MTEVLLESHVEAKLKGSQARAQIGPPIQAQHEPDFS